jgi:hypothetical protein
MTKCRRTKGRRSAFTIACVEPWNTQKQPLACSGSLVFLFAVPYLSPLLPAMDECTFYSCLTRLLWLLLPSRTSTFLNRFIALSLLAVRASCK